MLAAYAELHAHSYYSLLDGTSSPEALAGRAAVLGYPALALTDHDAVYGTVEFSKAAHEMGIKPIFGTELTLEGGYHLTVLVRNELGWRNLCYLVSVGQANAPKGKACLPFDALQGHTSGLITLSGCPTHGELPILLRAGDWNAARNALTRYTNVFSPGDFWIELQHHLLPKTHLLHEKLAVLARKASIGVVATNNVHYAHAAEHRLQDVLACIRHGAMIDHSAHVRRPNTEYYLKSPAQMARLFRDYPQAVTNTLVIAEQCEFSLQSSLQTLPTYPLPPDHSAESYLRTLCEESAAQRFGVVSDAIKETIVHELALIGRAGLANYFLIVWDIVKYARDNGIRCQGRGSAANSLVAYLLHISPINPLEHDLVFERFLSDERPTMPDVDIDFQADRREEVIQYCYSRYGHDHAAMAATFVTFRHKSALREVGKVMGLPPEVIEAQSRRVHARNRGGLSAEKGYSSLPSEHADSWQYTEALVRQIRGLPRHLGIHNGGMILTDTPITDRVATEPATMPGRSVVQWDKNALEDAGLIKIDILGLRMLSAIAETVRIVEQATNERIDLDALTFDDPSIYEMLCAADTIGVFQVESRAQAQVLPRLRPQKFSDLIISISLIRPGPVQGNMVHPFLRRRFGEEPVRYLVPEMESALSETLGVVLYQEQVLKVARDVAGFTPGEGELLRRALGKADSEKVARLRGRFIEGATRKGIASQHAETIFGQLAAFGGYSFPKSHAAAFAVLVYQSAWLKRYHPGPFYAALLNNQPMGFWSPAVLLGDARRHGFHTVSVNVNNSEVNCTVRGDTLFLGLKVVKGLGVRADNIVTARAEEPFIDLADFHRRTRLPHLLIERLIRVGAMDGWNIERRALLWQLGDLPPHPDPLPIPALPPLKFPFPALTHAERLAADYEILGLNAGEHVMGFYRAELQARHILGSADLLTATDGTFAHVAGLVVVHQSPETAKGHHFVTLEDEHGMINVIFHPYIYERCHEIVVSSPLLLVSGMLQRRGDVVNVIATEVAPLQ
jgi:error-prone DNA polymerase